MTTVSNIDASGYLLHSHKYTDSKVILRIFTREHGRISAIYRNSKKGLKVKPFTELSVEVRGSRELLTVRSLDEISPAHYLLGRSLFCGMYLNEILVRLLPERQANELVYDNYRETLTKLSQADKNNQLQEVLLRRFELTLLAALGLGISLERDCNDKDIRSDVDALYYFQQGGGWRPVALGENANMSNLFSGQDIADIRRQNWRGGSLRAAKRLCRLALHPLLGDKPLKSRELFS